MSGKPVVVGELAQEAAGLAAGVDDAAAGIEDRALGLLQRLDGGEDRVGVALGLRLVVQDARLLGRGIGGGGELDVLGDVDEHRAGAAVGGDVEGLVDGLGELGGVLHQPVVLGAGPGDADGVGLLEGVVADHEGRDLAGQDDDRDRVHQASVMPVTALVAPGPEVTRTTPGRPVERA